MIAPRFAQSAAVALCVAAAFPAPSAVAAPCDGISQALGTALTTVRIAAGLVRPTFVTAPPGDNERLFILEQDGRIRLVKNGVLQLVPFLDVSGLTRSPGDGGGNEQGLLGLAFHPDYAANGWFFIYHTDSTGANNVVARYERSAADQDVADSSSRQVVISFAHPSEVNHNGGMIAFGPDGQLYIGTGDGGGGCDPSGNAQNTLSPLGKLLRIHVDSLPYTVPADNPFVGHAGSLPEIWATGLRNPWRYSFDRLTGDLYVGDVGQDLWEEIDFSPASSRGGENYGWNPYEGTHCDPNPSCSAAPHSCSVDHYVPPVVEYTHGTACSVTGGYVYRGCRMPGLRGTYFYADFCAAFIKTFHVVGGQATDQRDRTAELAPGGGLGIQLISSFGEDARGELYVVDRGSTTGTGEVYKIVPPLSNLEVSGPGAAPFLLGMPDWTCEDLEATSSHPIVSYRVYRQSIPGDPFTCVHQGATPSWTGGDPEALAEGALYSYVVTALNGNGEETSPGLASDGTPRVLSTAACP